jgi:hypothetical protein
MSKFARLVEIVIFVCLLGTCALWSQIATPVAPRPGQRPRVEPCWQQAGISKSAMQERGAIARETRSQVEAVCANSSLTPQQRQQQIRQIHRQAKERQDALVSPSQLEALQACQKERAGAHPPAPGLHHGGGLGPCGEPAAVPTGHPNAPGSHPQNQNPSAEDETPPQL